MKNRLVNANDVDALLCQATWADSWDEQHDFEMMAADMQDILDMQSEIDVLRSEREACEWNQKMRVDRKINGLEQEVSRLYDAMDAWERTGY